jgi:hypothetical protein
MSTKQRIFIPTYISSVDYQPARVQPRILFYNGLKDCEPYFIASGSLTLGSNDAFEAFPYFDNYSGQVTETGSLSLLFFNEEAPYGVTPTGSLYTEYWEDYVELLYNPRTRVLNASAIIPLADYFKMELNDIVEFRGNYYHLRAINDYNLKNGECQIQLLGPILAAASPASQPACNYNGVTIICESPPVTTTTTTTATPGPCNLAIDYLIVGAGGEAWSGGGGAGQFISGSTSFPFSVSLPIVAGKITTGTVSSTQVSGAPSSFLGLTAIGGGNGGQWGSNKNPKGWNGASGGGASAKVAGTGGTALAGFNGGSNTIGGNGGGAGGGGAAGQGANSLVNVGAQGGAGLQWLDGQFYCAGGYGERIKGEVPLPQSGSAPSPGGGGLWGVGSSGPGMVKIRYEGTPRATGGTITQIDGYTYHTFTGTSVDLVSAFVFDCVVPGPTTTIAPTTTTTTTVCPNPIQCSSGIRVRNVGPSNTVIRWTNCDGGIAQSGIIPNGASYTISECAQVGSVVSPTGAILDITNPGIGCGEYCPPPTTTTTTEATTTTTTEPLPEGCETWRVSGGSVSDSTITVSYVQCDGQLRSATVTRLNNLTICVRNGTTPQIVSSSGNGSLTYIGNACF